MFPLVLFACRRHCHLSLVNPAWALNTNGIHIIIYHISFPLRSLHKILMNTNDNWIVVFLFSVKIPIFSSTSEWKRGREKMSHTFVGVFLLFFCLFFDRRTLQILKFKFGELPLFRKFSKVDEQWTNVIEKKCFCIIMSDVLFLVNDFDKCFILWFIQYIFMDAVNYECCGWIL